MTETTDLTLEQIDDVVCEILERDGPDRHVDGHEVITAFIGALLKGKGEKWAMVYLQEARLPWTDAQTAELNASNTKAYFDAIGAAHKGLPCLAPEHLTPLAQRVWLAAYDEWIKLWPKSEWEDK